MAENAWYEKHTKDVAAALKKAKAAPKEDALPCSLVKLPDGSYVLCILVNPSKTAALVKEAKAAHGKVVSAGRLYLGDDGPTFEVDVGDATVKVKFTAAAAEVGVPLHVTVKAAEAAPPPAPPTGTAALQAALSKLVPVVQEAIKAHPERKNDLLQPMARCKKQIEDDQPVEAKASLMEVGRILKEVGAPQEQAPPIPPPAVSPAEKDQLTGRLKAVKPRYAEAIQADPPNRAVLERAMAAIVQAAKDGDFVRGLKLLDGLEKALGAAVPGSVLAPADDDETAPTESEDGATSPDLLGDWQAALASVGHSLAALRGKLQQTGDPDLAVIADKGLTDLLKQLPGGLEAALKAAEAGGPDARKAVVPLLTKHRQFLESDKFIGELDANPFGETVAVRETLTKALDALDKALAAA